MASTPRVAPTNEVVETNGARTCASGVLFWAARVPYCLCGSCASSSFKSSTSLFAVAGTASTGPLLPSLVTKPERFHATHSTLHKLHRFIDRTREYFSALGVHARTSDTRSNCPRQDWHPMADSTIVVARGLG